MLHFAIILTAGTLFHAYWDSYFENQSKIYQILAIALFSTFIIYNLAVLLFSIFSGEKSKGEMKRVIKKESKKLASLLNDYSSEVQTIRAHLKRLTGVMKPEGFVELAVVESLLASLEGRLKKVQLLSKSQDEDVVYEAYVNLLDDLSNSDDAVNILSLYETVDPIPLKKLPTELSSRIAKVKHYVPAPRKTANFAH